MMFRQYLFSQRFCPSCTASWSIRRTGQQSQTRTWRLAEYPAKYLVSEAKFAQPLFKQNSIQVQDIQCELHLEIFIILVQVAALGCRDVPEIWGNMMTRTWNEGYPKVRFAKVIILSYSRPSFMIIASASQFHVYLPWGQCLFSIVS